MENYCCINLLSLYFEISQVLHQRCENVLLGRTVAHLGGGT
jgi:hypothetical protein